MRDLASDQQQRETPMVQPDRVEAGRFEFPFPRRGDDQQPQQGNACDRHRAVSPTAISENVPGYTYDRQAKLLRLHPGVLTAQDESLAVSVARECHRVIQQPTPEC